MAQKSRHAMPPSIEPVTTQLTPKALTKQEFGRRLHQRLLEKSWNQSDLARASGLGRDSISTYVNGKTFPTPLALKKLAQALMCEPEDLLPNAMMHAMDDEHPAVELKQASGHPGKAWLRVNRSLSFGTAAKIIALIDDEDKQEG